jgi:hypothetical protein
MKQRGGKSDETNLAVAESGSGGIGASQPVVVIRFSINTAQPSEERSQRP